MRWNQSPRSYRVGRLVVIVLIVIGVITLTNFGALPVRAQPSRLVMGADNRFRITNTTDFPYRAVAYITSNFGQCTGWVFAPNLVVTAGHCVYESGRGYAQNVRVFVGKNGTANPFGNCLAQRLFVPNGWASSQDVRYDYGGIKLNCTFNSGFGVYYPPGDLTGQRVRVTGYPGDKPIGTMWESVGGIVQSEARVTYYNADTTPGDSGAPVWQVIGGLQYVRAIHSGYDGTINANRAVRLTTEVISNLDNWAR